VFCRIFREDEKELVDWIKKMKFYCIFLKKIGGKVVSYALRYEEYFKGEE